MQMIHFNTKVLIFLISLALVNSDIVCQREFGDKLIISQPLIQVSVNTFFFFFYNYSKQILHISKEKFNLIGHANEIKYEKNTRYLF